MRWLKFFIVMSLLSIQAYGTTLDEEDAKEIINNLRCECLANPSKVKGLLYEIIMNRGSKEERHHYLLGTVHVLPKEFLKGEIIQKIKTADILVTEIVSAIDTKDFYELGDLSEFSPEEIESMGFLWNKNSPWTPGLSSFSSSHLELIREGIEPTIKRAWHLELDEIHPILIDFLVEQNIKMHESFINPLQQGQQTIDTFVIEEFLDKRKMRIGLETYKDRFKAADTLQVLTEEKDRLSLNDIIENIIIRIGIAKKELPVYPCSLEEQEARERKKNDFKKLYQKMIETCLHADVDDLSPLITPNTTKRNHNWLPKIQEIIRDNPKETILIMVGALHLAGEDGLINLLKTAGYSIVPFYEE